MTNPKAHGTKADKIRKLASELGYEAPIDPMKVPLEVRKKLGKVAKAGRWQVNQALVADRADPEERAAELTKLVALKAAEIRAKDRAAAAAAKVREAEAAAKRKAAEEKVRLQELARQELARRAAQRKKAARPVAALPQIPVVRLGIEEAWIVDAIASYRDSFEAEHGYAIDAAQVVRMALTDVLQRKNVDFDYGKSPGTAARIGPFRITPPYKTLPKAIAATADRMDTKQSDVIRGALAQWLIEKGFGEKAKRRGKGA
jgi:hypothetical protein